MRTMPIPHWGRVITPGEDDRSSSAMKAFSTDHGVSDRFRP